MSSLNLIRPQGGTVDRMGERRRTDSRIDVFFQRLCRVRSELEIIDDQTLRHRIWIQVRAKIIGIDGWLTLVTLPTIVIGVFIAIPLMIEGLFASPVLGLWYVRIAIGTLVSVLFVLAGPITTVVFEQTRLHRFVRGIMCENGIDVCVSCGHRLCGGRTPNCPECGARFV